MTTRMAMATRSVADVSDESSEPIEPETFKRFSSATALYPEWPAIVTDRRVYSMYETLRFAPPVVGVNENLFEWIITLDAVMEARGTFTMLEGGAGWGVWGVRAAVALRAFDPSARYRLILVEAEPGHYESMRRHCAMNGIRRRNRRGSARFVRAALAPTAGRVRFHVGASDRWYGQAIATPGSTGPTGSSVETVRATTLARLLRRVDLVDLIHLDIQGAELDVLGSSTDTLREKVRRVHIGTHGADVEHGLRELFNGLGWQSVHDFPGGGVRDTPYGRGDFEDGVQGWLNPLLTASSRSPAGVPRT
jgi:FkbM family methyltransferase